MIPGRPIYRREEAFKRFSMLDASWVIQGKDAKDVTGFKADTRLLDKLDYTVLSSYEWHIHLHDLQTTSSGTETSRLYHRRLTSISA
jgi:hypothetical protein